MQLPNTLKVGSLNYKIEEVSNLKHGDKDMYGLHKESELLIEINKDIPLDLKKVCLVHEVLHALLGYVAVSVTEEQEEQLAETLSKLLTEVLQENPDFVRYITGVRAVTYPGVGGGGAPIWGGLGTGQGTLVGGGAGQGSL